MRSPAEKCARIKRDLVPASLLPLPVVYIFIIVNIINIINITVTVSVNAVFVKIIFSIKKTFPVDPVRPRLNRVNDIVACMALNVQ